jgi:curved DNA-binding protein CbpA/thiol-disulfide isomerase/thioredoxin
MSCRFLCVALLVAAFVAVLPVSANDPYALLGVPRDATDSEIKKAFKKLARKYHPDALKGEMTEKEKESARKYFMSLSAAYETLSTPEKRKALDEGRMSAVDKNYLRYNLFHDDFSGNQAKSVELQKLMDGKAGSGIVFFWSPNFPDCIEAGINFKKTAESLDVTDITVFSFKCDDDPTICHQNRLGDLPAIMVYTPKGRERYNGKYDPYSMTLFALQQSDTGVSERQIEPDTYNVCPNPEESIKDKLAPYFLPTMKRCTLGQLTHEFVSFEYSRCHDCEIELRLARGLLGRIMPNLVFRRLDCSPWKHEDFCEDLELRSRDKAWTIAAVTKRCWWAMKKPFEFSHEECEPLKVTKFEGRYKAWDFVRFLMGRKKSQAIRLQHSDIPTIKQRDTAYAILYTTATTTEDDVFLRWSILAREINIFQPVVGKKGFPLKLATIVCESEAHCGIGKLPVVHLYGYGTKVKQQKPVEYSDLRSMRSLQRRILHDVEPLHLHILTPGNYNTKVMKGVEQGKNWLILYNAGQWCPPCNQIRPEWSTVARMVQDSEFGKKLSVGVMDCDAHGSMCQKLGLTGFPTMAFLSKGRARLEFQGDRHAQAVFDWATDMIDNRLLKIGGQELFERHQRAETMLIVFTAGAWCPPCTKVGPVMKKVAMKVDFTVASINCDTERHACQNFGIDGFPTIKMLVRGKVLDFNGDREVEQIASWAKKMK